MEKIANIPEGVEVNLDGYSVSVVGEKGKLKRDSFTPLFCDKVMLSKTEGKIIVKTDSDKRKIKSYVGTVASHIRNMITGVTNEWVYKLKIVYVHFPMTVKVDGSEIVITNFLGGKSPRRANVVGDVKVEIKGDDVIVSGIDREAVGQTSANIERSTKIKSKDRRIFQDGIFMTDKGVSNEI